MNWQESRRAFLRASAGAGLAAPALDAAPRTVPRGSICDVDGLKVGHDTDARRPTGCTVVLTEGGAVAGVDVRGGAPGTRETDLLNPVNTVQQVHAILLSGGSAFGLAAADGVVRWLEERGIGYPVGPLRVPIVPAAILFDLQVGDPHVRPTAESGYRAARNAAAGPPAQGNVGAGAGATVGKIHGLGRAMKGGLGTASWRLPNGLVIGALVAVNAVGDVVDPETGQILAGLRTPDGKALADTMAEFRRGASLAEPAPGRHTTIGVVAANVAWSKAQATKVAQMAQDGFARAIRPGHLPSDGDTIFALGTGRLSLAESHLGLIGALAADVMAQAVVSAILHAKGIPGYPAAADLKNAPG
ncbi:MAG TPA: P1 family peptidase [Bryobacteraceae bacterium]|nr:P1 family peptidase [Bryobacteraceae bacterium]